MRTFLIAFAVAASVAHAGQPKHCPTPAKPSPVPASVSPIAVAANLSSNTNHNALSASQGQRQAQQQGQSQSSRSNSLSSATGGSAASRSASSSSADNAGNSQSTAYSESMDYPRQAPPAIAGSVQPTASCRNARNGGASSPVGGLAFGWSTKDDECDLRETARMLFEMGQPQMAVQVLCQSKIAKNIPACQHTELTAKYPAGERDRRIVAHGGPDFGK